MKYLPAATTILLLAACGGGPSELPEEASTRFDPRVRNAIYDTVTLSTDLDALSENERRMIPLLIQAAQQMDRLFWLESWGPPDVLPGNGLDADQLRFFTINYGPWDRLAGDAPFIDGIGAKPLGARFYPADMSTEEFEAFSDPRKLSPYTLLQRGTEGELIVAPYHVAFAAEVREAARSLQEAADLAEDEGLRNYLTARAQALLTDEYRESDMAWLDMQQNTIDVIIGPIENYEDKLFGIKTAHECYIAVKDKEWSKKLEHFAGLLPDLQRGLPVPEMYRREEPGTDAQLGAYDVIYYAGDCNAGSKTIAVNLPNDEEVQLAKGTRRLQFKNAMRAKFDRIMVPIAGVLVEEEQRSHVTFNAFFENTMFHEVAHGLGIKHTVNGKGTVREALMEQYSALEEGKADVLGLYMVTRLRELGEIDEGELMDNYVTFMAGIFRSVRFGASSAHGKANMLRFNYFMELGAFERNATTGTYRVVPDRMAEAVRSLSTLILTLQGEGDRDGVIRLMEEKGGVGPGLAEDLERLSAQDIPVDVVFEQGMAVLRP
ncbi:MAG TPA: Zn-dependent hydrolase [Flavobacteriales bacterium]|nr:Zn-dependent hydrolase [Flavobacteriales bacterium]